MVFPGEKGTWGIRWRGGGRPCGVQLPRGGACQKWQEMPFPKKQREIPVCPMAYENSMPKSLGFTFFFFFGGSKSRTFLRGFLHPAWENAAVAGGDGALEASGF